MFYLVLIAVLSGGSASSLEYVSLTQFELVSETECETVIQNIDSVVLDNVTLLNGLLGYRVDWFTYGVKRGESSVLLGATLGYNVFAQTVTFDPGDLDITFNTCE